MITVYTHMRKPPPKILAREKPIPDLSKTRVGIPDFVYRPVEKCRHMSCTLQGTTNGSSLQPLCLHSFPTSSHCFGFLLTMIIYYYMFNNLSSCFLRARRVVLAIQGKPCRRSTAHAYSAPKHFQDTFLHRERHQLAREAAQARLGRTYLAHD